MPQGFLDFGGGVSQYGVIGDFRAGTGCRRERGEEQTFAGNVLFSAEIIGAEAVQRNQSRRRFGAVDDTAAADRNHRFRPEIASCGDQMVHVFQRRFRMNAADRMDFEIFQGIQQLAVFRSFHEMAACRQQDSAESGQFFRQSGADSDAERDFRRIMQRIRLIHDFAASSRCLRVFNA